MKDLLKSSYLAIVILSLVCTVPLTALAQDAFFKNMRELRQAKHEILGKQLIQALELTPEQIDLLLNSLYKIEQFDNTHRTEAVQIEEEALAILDKIKASTDTSISEELSAQYHQVKQKLHELGQERRWMIMKMDKELTGMLQSHQLETMRNLQPCISSQPHGKRQARYGSMRGSGFGQPGCRMLERVRRIPDDIYADHKEILWARFLNRAERHLTKDPQFDMESYKNKFFAILDEARTLSDVDFELQKADLAAQIIPDRPMKPRGKQMRLKTRLLLNPKLIPYLESLREATQ